MAGLQYASHKQNSNLQLFGTKGFVFFFFLMNLTLCTSTGNQARVIHNSNAEWQRITEAAEMARESAASNGDELGEITCLDLLEALQLSRCLFLMKYSHQLFCQLFPISYKHL